jgi:hypothetical protein
MQKGPVMGFRQPCSLIFVEVWALREGSKARPCLHILPTPPAYISAHSSTCLATCNQFNVAMVSVAQSTVAAFVRCSGSNKADVYNVCCTSKYSPFCLYIHISTSFYRCSACSQQRPCHYSQRGSTCMLARKQSGPVAFPKCATHPLSTNLSVVYSTELQA